MRDSRYDTKQTYDGSNDKAILGDDDDAAPVVGEDDSAPVVGEGDAAPIVGEDDSAPIVGEDDSAWLDDRLRSRERYTKSWISSVYDSLTLWNVVVSPFKLIACVLKATTWIIGCVGF